MTAKRPESLGPRRLSAVFSVFLDMPYREYVFRVPDAGLNMRIFIEPTRLPDSSRSWRNIYATRRVNRLAFTDKVFV